MAVSLKALKNMDKDDPNYRNVYADMEDRVRGFRNFFAQDLQKLLDAVE